MPKKILIFSTAYFPFVGGAEVTIKEITDRLGDKSCPPERRIEFDLITAKLDSRLPTLEKIENVNVYRIGFGVPIVDKLLLPFWGALKAKKLNKKNQYSALWCVMVSWASGAAYIANIFSRNKVPIVLTLQEGDSDYHLMHHRFGLIKLSWKLALSKSTSVTAISLHLARLARRIGHRKDIYVIPNGVDIIKFDIDIKEEERDKIRKNLGLDNSDIALVTTSRLVYKNGIGDVIKALAKLPKNIKFIICGTGELEIELKNLAKKIAVSDRVIFLGDVSHNEMPKILKSCDIFIRPSLYEGMGNSFIEAMATGRPVISTPVGGITDFLKAPQTVFGEPGFKEAGYTGYICYVENPQSIVRAVDRVLHDPNIEQVIANAKNLVQEKYDWSKIALKMKDIFDNISKS